MLLYSIDFTLSKNRMNIACEIESVPFNSHPLDARSRRHLVYIERISALYLQ